MRATTFTNINDPAFYAHVVSDPMSWMHDDRVCGAVVRQLVLYHGYAGMVSDCRDALGEYTFRGKTLEDVKADIAAALSELKSK
jgi:hypothetical protein